MRGWRAAAIACLSAMTVAGSARAAPKVGEPAPEFSAVTFGGNTVRLADLKGDVIILNFWATWCAPCRRELPLLEGLFREYGRYNFQILAVATEDSVPTSRLRPLASHLTMPLVKRLSGPYRELDGVPTNYVIDRSGKLVYAKAGAIDIDTFNEVVLPLLKAPMSEPPPETASSGSATKPEPAQSFARR